jgi:hypothetical protein
MTRGSNAEMEVLKNGYAWVSLCNYLRLAVFYVAPRVFRDAMFLL